MCWWYTNFHFASVQFKINIVHGFCLSMLFAIISFFVFCFGSVNYCYNFIFLSFLQNNWRISTTKKDNQINTHKKRTNDEPLYRYTPLPRDIPNARFVLVIFVCNCVSFVLFIARESSLSLALSFAIKIENKKLMRAQYEHKQYTISDN